MARGVLALGGVAMVPGDGEASAAGDSAAEGEAVEDGAAERDATTTAPASPNTFACSRCTAVFRRKSDLTRHANTHQPPTYTCPYHHNDPRCHSSGSFSRLDNLKRHLRLKHYVADKPIPPAPPTTAGWCIQCQKMFTLPQQFFLHVDVCAELAPASQWKHALT